MRSATERTSPPPRSSRNASAFRRGQRLPRTGHHVRAGATGDPRRSVAQLRRLGHARAAALRVECDEPRDFDNSAAHGWNRRAREVHGDRGDEQCPDTGVGKLLDQAVTRSGVGAQVRSCCRPPGLRDSDAPGSMARSSHRERAPRSSHRRRQTRPPSSRAKSTLAVKRVV